MLSFKNYTCFLGNCNKNFMGRRCLNSYTDKTMLIIHKPKGKKQEITTIRNSNENFLIRVFHIFEILLVLKLKMKAIFLV